MAVNPTGISFACLASLGATYTFINGAKLAPKLSPLLMTFWINAVGLIMILPLMYDSLALPQTQNGITALTVATVFYLIAILSQFQALARMPAATAAFILNLEPVVSILLAGLVLNEVLSLVQWSGVVLVISAVIISINLRPTVEP